MFLQWQLHYNYSHSSDGVCALYYVHNITWTILSALYYVHYIMWTILSALYCASHTPTSVGTSGRCTMHCMGVSHPENCSFCHNLLGLLFNQGNGPSLVHAVQCQPNKIFPNQKERMA